MVLEPPLHSSATVGYRLACPGRTELTAKQFARGRRVLLPALAATPEIPSPKSKEDPDPDDDDPPPGGAPPGAPPPAPSAPQPGVPTTGNADDDIPF
ncbi:unannotated protein [freshwater metagenome]|uniref:Unannotated protein n=1 Tax=freshwater metagenome TaxID=449393 RepID=A0A6J6PCD4_9ZZZZ